MKLGCEVWLLNLSLQILRVGCFKLVEHQKQKGISSVSNIWATKWEVHTLHSSEFDCNRENPKHSLNPVHCQSCPEFKYASSYLFYLPLFTTVLQNLLSAKFENPSRMRVTNKLLQGGKKPTDTKQELTGISNMHPNSIQDVFSFIDSGYQQETWGVGRR